MITASRVWWTDATLERKCRQPRGAYAKAVADYTLSHDPSGDYARRAQFSALEVATMQADGVLDEGAVYAHKSGRVFVVRRGELRERKHGKANPTHKRRA